MPTASSGRSRLHSRGGGVPDPHCTARCVRHWLGGEGGGGVDTALWLDPLPPKKGSLTGPPKTYRDDPQAPEVTRTQNSAKNENGLFGISASRGFRKIIFAQGGRSVQILHPSRVRKLLGVWSGGRGVGGSAGQAPGSRGGGGVGGYPNIQTSK